MIAIFNLSLTFHNSLSSHFFFPLLHLWIQGPLGRAACQVTDEARRVLGVAQLSITSACKGVNSGWLG
jgi:hypothetical protein